MTTNTPALPPRGEAQTQGTYPVGDIHNIGQIAAECRIAGERLLIASGVMKGWSDRFFAFEATLLSSSSKVASLTASVARLREAMEPFAKHFIVKPGPKAATNQYGHLELWWAASSVNDAPDAGKNPWMLLAAANNSYELAAMSELGGALEASRSALAGEAPDADR